MSVLTPARLGLARIGATRLGYPVSLGVRLPKKAQLGIARLGATRLGVHSAETFITIDGVHYGSGPADAGQIAFGLTTSEILNETPNTARLIARGFRPGSGKDVIVTLGSKSNYQRQFAGKILRRTQSYVGTPSNALYALELIDYTWGLNTHKVTALFQNQTLATIIGSLVSTYAPGYTVRLSSDVSAIVLDQISFTKQDLTACLTQTTKRAGTDWKCTYDKVVAVGKEAYRGTDPSEVNAVNPLFLGIEDEQKFEATYDLSQVLTRVYVEGGGGVALQDLVAGETIIPIDVIGWYQAAGGVVVSQQNILIYASVDAGGGGSLVGPGAQPVSALVLAVASGAGIESGAHVYAVTYVTGSGESLPSPLVAITVGLLSPPSSAPAAGAPTLGTGPDPGSHDYAVTFVTPSGETTAGPILTKATGLTAAPSSAPTAGTPTAGSGVDDGTHDYAVSFVTSIGETTPSPISGQVTAGPVTTGFIADPSTSMTATGQSGGSMAQEFHAYALTFVNAAGETKAGPTTQIDLFGTGFSAVSLTNIPVGPAGTVSKNLYRIDDVGHGGVQYWQAKVSLANATTSYTDTRAGDHVGNVDAPPSSNTTATTTAHNQVPLTGIPLSAETINGRNLYRRSGGAGLKLLAYIGDNSTTSYTDTTPNASLGAAAPAVNTAYLQRIPLTAIPTGSALVTARKIYRTAAGAAQRKLVTTLSDNTTTTFTDTVTDASLGANEPTSNTATANQVSIASIPLGAATVTSRKLYRTVAGASQLKLLATIADNTTTTYVDSSADASLGANAPSSDTSGLTQQSGVVLAGSLSLISAGVGWANAAGGWAIIGNGQQVIRYAGISGNTLIGIPATGVGAITASIAYNSTVTAAPCLRGVPASGPGSILYPILKGDPVNLRVQVDDLDAQAALAAYIGGDGVQEDILTDNRLSYTESLARGRAWLDFRKDVLLSTVHRTRDLNTIPGHDLPINLGSFAIDTTLKVQQVDSEGFGSGLFPVRTTHSSSVRVTFEDWLRLVKEQAARG